MRAAVVLLLAGWVAGCTHTHPLTLSTPEGRAAVTARAVRGDAVVRLDGEPPRLVDDLTVDADTTRWTDRRSGRVRAEPTARVRAVSFRRDGRGALTGVGVGIGLGLVLGLAADAEPRGWIHISTAQWLAIGAADGAVIGAIIGAMRSDRVVYRR